MAIRLGLRKFQLALGVLALSAGSITYAAPPATAIGSWLILADQEYTTLTITAQGGPGAPSSARCRVLLGTIENAPIRGIYCPDSGHIQILHNNIDSKVTVRTFTGTLSAPTSTAPAHIAGTMHVMYGTFGDFGEYPFSGTKQ